MISKFLVLGGGSAGLLAALSLQRKFVRAKVTIVCSSEMGVIGVGESTTPNVPVHLFETLGIAARKFYEIAEPTWKLGIHFIWGPRDSFQYTFRPQLDVKAPDLSCPNGYYCDDKFYAFNIESALMAQNKMFMRSAGNGAATMLPGYAFHLENRKFVKALEMIARERGIEFIDGKLQSVERGPMGVAAIVLEDGRRLDAEFFIDSSGFRSELLGRELKEPFISYGSSLFNDRSIVGGWERTDEPIHPYTTAETMNAGWSWRIDHEKIINRGYVYSSAFISDDEARAEFAKRNPKANVSDRVIKFQTGRHERGWVDNVLAIGNSGGFAEPLEATALMLMCWQCETFIHFLNDLGNEPSVRDLYNKVNALAWDEVRDFLTLHFKFNSRLETPYWKTCRNEADISRLREFIDFYQEAGPSGFNRYNLANPLSQFGLEGYLVIMAGNRVPYKNRYQPRPAEMHSIKYRDAQFQAQAQVAYGTKESLQYVRSEHWRWAVE